MSQIGLQMYTMRKHAGTPEEYRATLQKVSEIGYRVLQVTPPSFYSDDEFMSLLGEYGLRPDSVFVPTGKICESMEKARRQADCFGVDVMRTDSIPKEMRQDADGYHRYAALLNREGRACKNAGIRLMYHFHAFEWIRFGDIHGMDILMNETDPDAVYFQPDVFWLTCAGLEVSRALQMFRGRTFSMHLKDYAIQPLTGAIEDKPFNYAPVGTGNLNWKEIMASAKDIGIQRYVVEQDECIGDEFAAIDISYRALRKMGLE